MNLESRSTLLIYPPRQKLRILNIFDGNIIRLYQLLVRLLEIKLSIEGFMVFKGAARATPFFILI